MYEKIIACIFSLALIVFGQILVKRERMNLRSNKGAREKKRISTKQVIRRIICSYLIIAIGLMIFIGFVILKLEEKPIMFSIYWGCCFLLVFLLLLLAYGDMKEILFHFYGRPPTYGSSTQSNRKDGEWPDER